MLTIDRKKDNRVVKCILHRVADIPGGVTVNVAKLGGGALFEGTPIGKGSNGLYEVVKTAQIIKEADADATKFQVAKGHHFLIDDYFGTAALAGQKITAIDKSNANYDEITVGTKLSTAKVTAGTCAFATNASTTTPAVTPVAMVGSNYDVVPNTNLFVDAWVIGVVRESNAPIVTAAIQAALKGIVYV